MRSIRRTSSAARSGSIKRLPAESNNEKKSLGLSTHSPAPWRLLGGTAAHKNPRRPHNTPAAPRRHAQTTASHQHGRRKRRQRRMTSAAKRPRPSPRKRFPDAGLPRKMPYPQNQKWTSRHANGTDKATLDMKRPHTDPEGVWHQKAFEGNPNLKSSLDSYSAAKKPGDKGFSVKTLDVNKKKPEQLHNELQAAGFEYHREPLLAFESKDGTKNYRLRQKRWEVNGKPVREGTAGAVEVTTTTNKNDKDVVPHDIYQHPDGGLVRIKPERGRSQRTTPLATSQQKRSQRSKGRHRLRQ